MQATQTVPVLRIFDIQKAREFYIDWLGLAVDWEHRFAENLPLYMQVSGYGMTLHLSEHHGDCTPGSKVVVRCSGLKNFHQALTRKNYPYNKPELEKAPWNAWTMEVTDPFGNKLLFNEPTD